MYTVSNDMSHNVADCGRMTGYSEAAFPIALVACANPPNSLP